jgi:hypothetical protein
MIPFEIGNALTRLKRRKILNDEEIIEAYLDKHMGNFIVFIHSSNNHIPVIEIGDWHQIWPYMFPPAGMRKDTFPVQPWTLFRPGPRWRILRQSRCRNRRQRLFLQRNVTHRLTSSVSSVLQGKIHREFPPDGTSFCCGTARRRSVR